MEAALLFLQFLFAFLLPAAVRASDSLLSTKGVNYKGDGGVGHKFGGSMHMVACSPEGFVTSLEMANMGLSGILSPSVGNLSHLRTLLLQNNRLLCPTPSEIGKLSEIQTLDLSGNQFDGGISSSLGYLTHLSYLRLNHNKLSGQIPSLVANITGLSFLDLSFNNPSGPTPKILAKGYSITGNCFLCTGQTCIGESKPMNGNCPSRSRSRTGTAPSPRANDHHNNNKGRQRWMLSVATGLGCTFVVSVMLVVCLVHWYRSRFLFFTSYVQQDYEVDIGQLKRFTFPELQVATSNFSSKNILGQGGFGVVYKGCLQNNKTLVAVKRLKDLNYTGEVQFQTEVEMIGLALHRNLPRLYGFCITPEERLLVYPYMPNGSVADRLRESCSGGRRPCLDWNRRMRIALGTERGLVYSHEQCNPRIIHRDVKAANILLDESFEAVVGDFGLAKLLDRRDSHVTTAVRGTVGHIAPEYLSTGQSSEKTDVFGFGILLLELITGQKPPLDAAGNGPPIHKGIMILDSVRILHEEKRLHVLADRDLKGCFDASELEKAAELALECTQAQPQLRPRMSQVLKVQESLG